MRGEVGSRFLASWGWACVAMIVGLEILNHGSRGTSSSDFFRGVSVSIKQHIWVFLKIGVPGYPKMDGI